MVKKAKEFKTLKKRNGKFVVRKRGGEIVHGEEKTKLLQEAGLVKKMKAKAKAEAPAEG